MKVLFIPYSEEGNPYQKLLVSSLSKLGVETKLGEGLSFFPFLRPVIHNWKPDIVHTMWTNIFFLSDSKLETLVKLISFIIEVLIVKSLGIKIVWTVHNKYNHEKKHLKFDILSRIFLSRICNFIEVKCECAKNEIIKLYRINSESKINIVPHGNYIGIYPNKMGRDEFRNQLGFHSDDFVFLYVGSIRPYKGVIKLIEEFSKLTHPKAKLLIAGSPRDAQMRNGIWDKCKRRENIRTAFEFIPDNELSVYMNAADLVVLPYQDILTSSAVILAMSFSKPVIAPAMGCIPEVLDDKGSFLYNPTEKEGLLKAMKQAFGAEITKMGKHNFKLAQQLGWHNIAQKTYEIYQKCLKNENFR